MLPGCYAIVGRWPLCRQTNNAVNHPIATHTPFPTLLHHFPPCTHAQGDATPTPQLPARSLTLHRGGQDCSELIRYCKPSTGTSNAHAPHCLCMLDRAWASPCPLPQGHLVHTYRKGGCLSTMVRILRMRAGAGSTTPWAPSIPATPSAGLTQSSPRPAAAGWGARRAIAAHDASVRVGAMATTACVLLVPFSCFTAGISASPPPAPPPPAPPLALAPPPHSHSGSSHPRARQPRPRVQRMLLFSSPPEPAAVLAAAAAAPVTAAAAVLAAVVAARRGLCLGRRRAH